jgi:hypothetical protein
MPGDDSGCPIKIIREVRAADLEVGPFTLAAACGDIRAA